MPKTHDAPDQPRSLEPGGPARPKDATPGSATPETVEPRAAAPKTAVGMGERFARLTADQREQLSAKLSAAAETLLAEPIAIVGMGCRLPGSVDTPDDFWRLLVEGRDAVGGLPAGRWDGGPADADARLGHGGYLDQVAGFDAEFFGVSPREAAAMDPQHRLLLEVAWEALERAGIPPRVLDGSPTGVFVGVYYNDYLREGLGDPDLVDAYTLTGGVHSVAVGRLSYLLNLHGPSVAVDSACSSSLVAVHQACQSLRLRECSLALAGGVSLLLRREMALSIDRYGLLSRDGRCKSFDAGADGIARAEGCGMVVLKRLTDALRDRDRVLAVIRASCVNQDGHSNGLTAPSGDAQRELFARTVTRAGVRGESVGLIETHGTGTALGDPIEVEALAKVYGAGAGRCALGAVKTNLGHLEAASGVAGLIKAVLCVSRGEVPANLNFSALNPEITLDGTRFFVPTARTGWPAAAGPRLAAVSSFGIGGTNAHAIVEQAPDVAAARSDAIARQDGEPLVFTVSAASGEGLAAQAVALADWLEAAGSAVPLADVGRTLALRRAHLDERLAVIATDRAELVDGLRARAAGRPHAGTASGRVSPDADGGAVWIFSGHGSQWTGMGRELLDREPAFAAAIDALEPVYAEEAGIRLREEIGEGTAVAAGAADRIQPLLYAMQTGLAAVWRGYGLRPAAVIGYSMGEIAAAAAAGVLTPEDGARLICRRSRLLAPAVGAGAMALVELPAAEVERRLAEWSGQAADTIAVAIMSSPDSTVVSGHPERLGQFTAALRAKGVEIHTVASDVAFHSPQMDPLRDALAEAVRDIPSAAPRVPFYSATLDDPRAAREFGPGYWAANLREPVRFAGAVAAAAQDGYRAFLEVSPHPVVTRSIRRTLLATGTGDCVVAHSLVRGEPERLTLLDQLGLLHCHGVRVGWDRLYSDGPPADLPTTVWQRRDYWLAKRLAPISASPSAMDVRAAADDRDDTQAIPADWVYRAAWRPVPVCAVPGHEPGTWLLIADRTGVAEAFARLVEGSGGRCVSVSAAELQAADEARRAELLVDADRVGHVLDCSALDAEDDERDRAAPATRMAAGLLHVLRHLISLPGVPPRLRVVTRRAQVLEAGTPVNVAQATLWGLGRSIAVEHPDIWGGLADLDDAPPEAAAAALFAEAAQDGDEDQVAYRDGARYVARLESGVLPSQLEAPTLAADGCHLIIGANGSIAPSLIAQLVSLGARHLVLVSRRGSSAAAADASAQARHAGAQIYQELADVTDEAAMAALFARFGAGLPPLHGVYNLAWASGFTDLERMTDAELGAMLAPKVTGTDLLHRLSLGHDVRQFVLFSSISALLGSRGIAHYTAANSFLDAFAHARTAAGLPALAVNWGAWARWVAADDQYRDLMASAGTRPMPDERAIAVLGRLLAAAPGQYVIASMDWPLVAESFRARTAMRLLDELAPPGSGRTPSAQSAVPISDSVAPGSARPGTGSAPGEVMERVRRAGPVARRRVLREHVRLVLAQEMGFDSPRWLGDDQRLFQLGMDSLIAKEVCRRLSVDLGTEMVSSAVFNHPTVQRLTDHLSALVSMLLAEPDESAQDDGPHDEAYDGTDDDTDDWYDDLDEEALLDRLAERVV